MKNFNSLFKKLSGVLSPSEFAKVNEYSSLFQFDESKGDDEVIDVIDLGHGQLMPVTVRDEKEVSLIVFFDDLGKFSPKLVEKIKKYMD